MTRTLFMGASLLAAATAHANERHFTYTYDTLVLPRGIREVEVWTTLRPRDEGLLIDNRVELELPVTDRLLTSLYLNSTSSPDGVQTSVSNEWKLQLVNPTVKPVGLALYGEVGLAPSETELEAKILLDHHSEKFLVAYNLVGEVEFEREFEAGEGEVEEEYVVENDLGIAFLPVHNLSVGLEIRNHNEFPEGEFEHAVFFAGPTLGFTSEDFWVAATALPQIGAFMDDGDGETQWGRELEEHESFNGRVLVGVNF